MNGERLGSVALLLRPDVVPKTAENFRFDKKSKNRNLHLINSIFFYESGPCATATRASGTRAPPSTGSSRASWRREGTSPGATGGEGKGGF